MPARKTAFRTREKNKKEYIVPDAPFVHIPHISERDDTLLHQIPQVLDRRAGIATGAYAAPDGRQERAPHRRRRRRGVRMQALSVPLARRGRHRHRGSGARTDSGGAWLLLLLLGGL